MSDKSQHEKMTPERFGEAAMKIAQDTAYVAAGIANVIAEKTKELIESQRSHLAERTPEGVDPNFKTFVEQMPDQFKALMDDAQKQFQELAERGRTVISDLQASANKPKAEAFDLKEDADAEPEAAQDEDAVAEQIHIAEERLISEGGHVEESDDDK